MNHELIKNHKLQIVATADGSNTIWNEQVGENYHSKYGALQESRHVFVNSGLNYFLDGKNLSEISILEVGFGTGLNFLLSADACTTKPIVLDYTGIEAYPLVKNMLASTTYDQYCSPALWGTFIENYEQALAAMVELNAHCKLRIANCKLPDFQSAKQYDVIYFDAFAAAHQPEMWDETAIKHTLQFLKPGGVFVTYAITGNLKRIIKSLGLKVEKAPGAPGKREMLRAVK
ncbi:MAG: tRNA (5-methylaminomethyl-2-thiouridylate)-methyltransferase [Sphingobacteriaceae bacterium]|nr:MAG: tRNA (5-methylaminomethyl-2-thiouridylate)-methyltransferase [Sphingobacteriaceae bacterium]